MIFPPYKQWYKFGWRSPSILFARLRNKHRPLFRLRMTWQRAWRGYSDEQCWNLSHSLAKLTVFGVQNLRKWMHGHPGELDSIEEWDAILGKIEDGFQAWLDADGWFGADEAAQAKYEEAMVLYAKWFGGLWD